MLRAVVAVVALVFSSAAAAGDHEAAVKAVMAQEQAWADALLANDLETVDALMHPAFRLIRTYADDAVVDKAAYLGMQGMSASAIELTSARVEVMDGVAVAHVTMEIDWRQEGVGQLPPAFVITDTWRKDETGTWRILSRVSQLASPPAADKD